MIKLIIASLALVLMVAVVVIIAPDAIRETMKFAEVNP